MSGARSRPLPPIVVDTREPLETAYTFDGYQTVRRKLDAGDYSLEGYESQVAVERKEAHDAWACAGGERERFEACAARLALLKRPLIVIEASLDSLCVRPGYVERTQPASVVGLYESLAMRHGIQVRYCPNRAYAERITLRWLAGFWKHMANGR